MATGVTAAKYTKIYCSGYDFSGQSNSVSIGLAWNPLDVTAFASTVKENIFEIPSVDAELKMWFNNTATSGNLAVLSSPAALRVLCVAYGMRANPVVGDVCACVPSQQLNYKVDSAIGAAVGVTLSLKECDPTQAGIGNIFGVVLHANGQETGTGNAASVDGLAATTNGGMAFLQVTAAGGVWAIAIQDSANDSTFATIATFTSNGSSITQEALAIAGTIRRYTRVLFTRTSGNLNFFCGLVRA